LTSMTPVNVKNLPSKFFHLYERFEECRRWIEDCFISLRSERTVKDYAEALAQFVEYTRKDPAELVKMDYGTIYELMRKFVLWRVREVGVSPKRAHTQWFALVKFFRFHKVNGEFDFPSRSIPVVVKYLDKIPTRQELAKILEASKLDISTKIGIHLIAYAGIRPVDINNLTYACVKDDLERGIEPCAVWVPQGKTGLVYVTFIPSETVELLKQYFDKRRKAGEEITDSSPLIIDWIELRKTGRVKGIQRKSLCLKITRAMRHSGIKMEENLTTVVKKMRPYSLRKYFRSNLTGHMPNEYIEAMLGHTSGLEHVYGGTRDLDPATIERMREAYKNCLQYLQATRAEATEEQIKKAFKKELLLVAGYSNEDVEAMNLDEMSDEELRSKIREKLLGMMANNGAKQRVVTVDDVDDYLAKGWEFVAALPKSKVIMRTPS